jgi:hypothetical protein
LAELGGHFEELGGLGDLGEVLVEFVGLGLLAAEAVEHFIDGLLLLFLGGVGIEVFERVEVFARRGFFSVKVLGKSSAG